MRKFIVLTALAITGCTDSSRAWISQYGDESAVQCFSGGQIIYSGTSTGKISSNAEEDGLYFKEKESGKFVRLYADCIVKSL